MADLLVSHTSYDEGSSCLRSIRKHQSKRDGGDGVDKPKSFVQTHQTSFRLFALHRRLLLANARHKRLVAQRSVIHCIACEEQYLHSDMEQLLVVMSAYILPYPHRNALSDNGRLMRMQAINLQSGG